MVEPADDASVRAWLAEWGGRVASADIDGARPMFDEAVVGFGTRAELAEGIDRLVAEQWRHVWPAIEGFAFDVAGAHVLVSDDRLTAVVATTWTSEGPRADGTVGERPGRATVVLRRRDPGAAWLGVHTHFSLVP